MAVGGDHMIGQVDADLRGRLHQMATAVGVLVVHGQQRPVPLEHDQQSTDPVGIDHQRSPAAATRRR